MKQIVSITLDPEMVERIDRLKTNREGNRSLMIRDLLREALDAREGLRPLPPQEPELCASTP